MNNRNALRHASYVSRFRIPKINWLGFLGLIPALLVAIVLGGYGKSSAKSAASP